MAQKDLTLDGYQQKDRVKLLLVPSGIFFLFVPRQHRFSITVALNKRRLWNDDLLEIHKGNWALCAELIVKPGGTYSDV